MSSTAHNESSAVGLPFLPYSIGHEILLGKHTAWFRPLSPDITGADLAAQIVMAVWILGQSANEFLGDEVPDRMIAWKMNLRPFDAAAEAEKILHYIGAGTKRLRTTAAQN